jgi:glycerophosphoryl diester phosphodiesterase
MVCAFFYLIPLWKKNFYAKIGHRGAKGHEVENTLLGFQTIDLHVDCIELDVHLSADEIIVIHDETLDRTTNGKGAVNQYTIPELKRLK